MAAKLLNTILVFTSFLLALLLVIRMIRMDEGFQDGKPKEEQYDLNLFFKDYPIQKICDIYTKGFPTVQNSFSIAENGDKVPDNIAKLQAEDYLRKVLIGGIVSCPFALPKSTSLKSAYDFVTKLDEQLFVKAFSTCVYFTANLQLSAETSKKEMSKMEGFISECSADEIQNKAVVPLQCIPAETMKATEQKEINEVDRFEMEQRVSQKAQISKKLGTMVKNLVAFQTEFRNLSKQEIGKNRNRFQKSQAEFEFYSNPSELIKNVEGEEKIEQKKQEWKAEMEKSKNDLQMSIYYFKFSMFPLKKLVDTYFKLQKEVEGVTDELESGIPGAPKN